jgi:isoquinoline 1-oxidoreductase beta subunit
MLSRRTFLLGGLIGGAAAGGGLSVGFWLWRKRRLRKSDPRPDAYIRIGTDDRITLTVDESEMGQGVTTALPMILAEELDADWSKVTYEQAPLDPARFGNQWTASSTSVRRGYEPLRRAGAAAREMLVAAAAQQWGVPASECTTREGVVRHERSGRSARYGELAEAAARLPIPEQPRLKDPSEFTIIGTARARLDLPAKVDGSAGFGIDVKVPNMLVAQVEHPPVFGAGVASVDAKAAEAVSGVRRVAVIPTGVAVIADHFYAAQEGRKALSVTWNEGQGRELSSEGIESLLAGAVAGSAALRGEALRDDGDAAGAIAGAATKVEATYVAPYLAHAAMEPLNCTAHVTDGACEIWVPSQSPIGVRETAAEVLGIPPERVTVHTTLLGGGFGRRGAQDFVIDALHASKAAGAPVKVIWTREDDVRGGQYRPAAVSQMAGGLDAQGWPVAWQHAFAQPTSRPESGGALELPYEIANVRVTGVARPLAIPTYAWRSVSHSIHAWVVESFLDELAAAGGKDPVELRLRLLAGRPRHRKVVEVAAEKAGWGSALPAGRARGIATHEAFGSFMAEVAEVSVENGEVKVHRVVCALDCGQVINPDTVMAQVEGGIVYGLSAALYGQVRIAGGRAVESNFHDYRVLRLPSMPAIETVLIDSHASPGGAGEPSTPPIAPAVCNALRALRGQPVRRLPIAV